MTLFIKKLFLFLLPLLFVILIYVLLDPFKVIRSYDTFFEKDVTSYLSTDEDYVSTANFDKHYKVEKYNSFIFGNSRSGFYEISDWKEYLPANSSCYHFAASLEALYSLEKKVAYIDAKGLDLKNALFIFDNDLLSKDKPNDDGHLFMTSPQLLGYSNFISFHMSFIKAFLTPKFTVGYIDYVLSGRCKNYMSSFIVNQPMKYDNKINEKTFPDLEDQIKKNQYYNTFRRKEFYNRDSVASYSTRCIGESQKMILEKIETILRKHNTSFRIVISPLYDQKRLNKDDIKCLNDIFGKQNVYDFSGINNFTKDYTNYYEHDHYRPVVCKEIMKVIYKYKII